jgi:hypothetical protein
LARQIVDEVDVCATACPSRIRFVSPVAAPSYASSRGVGSSLISNQKVGFRRGLNFRSWRTLSVNFSPSNFESPASREDLRSHVRRVAPGAHMGKIRKKLMKLRRTASVEASRHGRADGSSA